MVTTRHTKSVLLDEDLCSVGPWEILVIINMSDKKRASGVRLVTSCVRHGEELNCWSWPSAGPLPVLCKPVQRSRGSIIFNTCVGKTYTSFAADVVAVICSPEGLSFPLCSSCTLFVWRDFITWLRTSTAKRHIKSTCQGTPFEHTSAWRAVCRNVL